MTSTAPFSLVNLTHFLGKKITSVHYFFYKAYNIDIHQISKPIIINKIKTFLHIINQEYKHILLRDNDDSHHFWNQIFTEDMPQDSPVCVLNKLANICVDVFTNPPSDAVGFAYGVFHKLQHIFEEQAHRLLTPLFPPGHICQKESYDQLYDPNATNTILITGIDILLKDDANVTVHHISVIA
jgi:hypothetical protein